MAPHANKMLTKIIAGRTIASTELQDKLLLIHFVDGSIIKIKTGEPWQGDVAQRTIRGVRQTDEVISFDFTDKSSMDVRLAEPGSSVMLRDGQGVMEYAD